MADKGGYGRRLPAGVIDSGFASLATFIVGLAAVNLLDDVNRGVYAVYFTAFVAGTMLPRQLIFTPAEVTAVSFDTDQRLSVVPDSIRLGIGPALVGTLAAGIAWLVTLGYASSDVSGALLVTCAAAIVLSPIQDHVRKMLHIATESWRAASVSVVQFAAVGIAVAVAIGLDIPIAWIPFGALTCANAVSLTFAWVVSQRRVERHPPQPLGFRDLAHQGVWLVVFAAAPAVAGFAIAAIVAGLASPEALGYAESARVVAQPILVLAAGITAVLSPRSMRAAMEVDLGTARHTSRVYLTIMALGGLGYIAIAGWDWALNPMSYLVPSAFVVSGLVAVAVVANVMRSMTFLQGSELLGAHRERPMALIAWIVAPVAVVVSLSAGTTEAFARPLSFIASAGTRFVLQGRELRTVYRTDDAVPVGGSSPD